MKREIKISNRILQKMALPALGAFVAVSVAVGVAGCGSPSATTENTATVPPTDTMTSGNSATIDTKNSTVAVADLKPTKGSKISGTVTFTKVADGVKVDATLFGLTPGEHGFHVHEKGDCSSPDGKSAGGHFNPTNMPHGAPDDAKRHVGDLGNITAGADGKAQYTRVDKVISLDGPNSIVGKAVIVHQGADDLKSQPSGDAGARGACGVIDMMKNQ